MPRVTKRPKRKTGGLPSGAVHHCAAGRDFFRAGFGDDLEAMRRAWEEHPELREAAWSEARRRDLLRPGAWWLFDTPERRNEALSEAEQLHRMNALTEDDLELIEQKRAVYGGRHTWPEKYGTEIEPNGQ